MKKSKKVLIKSYKNEFIKLHELFFKTDCDLSRAFNGNNYVMKLINAYKDNNSHNLVYEYEECEILSNYCKKNNITEEEIKKINKLLIDNIFVFTECNFKYFIFISIYSFVITEDGKPILFDFGLNKFLLSTDELMEYYAPNKIEIGSSLFPNKTNVMNYGITLLKCFFGPDLKIKIINNKFELPVDKKMSNEFCNFLRKCLYKNINKRYIWLNLSRDEFINKNEEINKNKDIYSDNLLDSEILKKIFDSLEDKFESINEYYSNLKYDQNTPYINEIENFLILILFEMLIIIKFFDKDITKPFTSQQEILFLAISNNNDDPTLTRFSLNFANPLFNDVNIINSSDYKLLIPNFIQKIKQLYKLIMETSIKIHKITKSTIISLNYTQFLQNFINNFEKSKFHQYFFSFIKKLDDKQKNNDLVYKELKIAEYVCECILFVKTIIFENNKDKIYFSKEEYLKIYINDFHKLFNSNIEISLAKINEIKNKYILVSFLGVLFRYYKISMDINNEKLKNDKIALDGLLSFYPSLLELIISYKNKIKNQIGSNFNINSKFS